MPKIIHNGITYTGLPDIDYDCEITTVTLYAANWSNGVYTITDSRIDSTTVQEFLPAIGITDDQLAALQSANIHDNGQDNGHAYLKVYGATPSIDIPIRIIFNPGVKTKEVEARIGYDLLWTNPNGTTTGSTFAAQKLSLDLSKYSFLCIIVIGSTESNSTFNPSIKTGYGYCRFSNLVPIESDEIYTLNSGGVMRQATRKLTADSTGIEFQDAINHTDRSVMNTMLIPLKIYGIK